MSGFPGSPNYYIAGAVFALVLLPASGTVGFGIFLVNLLVFAGFFTPFVVSHLERRNDA